MKSEFIIENHGECLLGFCMRVEQQIIGRWNILFWYFIYMLQGILSLIYFIFLKTENVVFSDYTTLASLLPKPYFGSVHDMAS